MPRIISPLAGVEALTFDVFATAVDWLGTVSRELESQAKAKGHTQPEDWITFATEQIKGYSFHTLSQIQKSRDQVFIRFC